VTLSTCKAKYIGESSYLSSNMANKYLEKVGLSQKKEKKSP